MKAVLLAAVSIVALATTASTAASADLWPGMKAPPPQVAPVFTWTGLSIGVAGAYIAVQDRLSGPAVSHTNQPNGALFGGGIGYDWQTDAVVWGVSTDFAASRVKGSTSIGPVTQTTRLDSFGTVRGRIGYAIDRTLFFATGGVAYAVMHSSEANGATFASTTALRPGWVIGAGVEYAVVPEWTVRAEGLYAGLGLKTAADSHLNDFKFRDSAALARVSANYKF